MATIFKRKGKYQVQIRRVGQPFRAKSFSYLADAKHWALKIESGLERGEAPSRINLKVEFNALANRYAETIVPHFKSANRELDRLRLMQKRVGSVSVGQMTNSFFAEYRDSRLKKVSVQTVKHEINIVRRVLKHAVQEWGLVLPLGVPSVRLPKMPKGRSRRLTTDELSRIKKRLSPLMKDLVDLALETGMRRSELLAVSSTDIEWESRRLKVIDSKNGSSRIVPLTLCAYEVLSRAKVTGRSFALAPDSVSQAFRRAVKAERILT